MCTSSCRVGGRPDLETAARKVNSRKGVAHKLGMLFQFKIKRVPFRRVMCNSAIEFIDECLPFQQI